MTDSDKPEEAGVPECGRQLRRTREKLGLTVDDVAAELRLSGFQIQALEDDDWSQLPGATYARGYLRSYARLIGLDADQLMAGASTQEIEMSSREPEIAARSQETPGRDAGEAAAEAPAGAAWRWAGVAVVLAVIAVGYWQYREGGSPVPADTGQSDAAVYEDSDGQESGRSTVESAGAAGDTGSEAATSGPVDEGAPPTPVAPDKAVFELAERSWIDVRDARGERLLYRSFPAGRRVEIQGQPPFRVYIGNARAVRIEYMGDVVTPDAGSGRLYARLVLGGSSG